MKRLLAILVLAATTLMVAACAGMLPTTGTTFNDKAAALERDIQIVQVTATALLRAEKISVTQDQQIQANVRLVHNGIVAAKAAQPKDPAGADADLLLVSKQVDALKDRTGVKP